MVPGGSIGKILIVIGVVLIVLGLIILLSEKMNLGLFKLPGDIVVKRENFTFYFPIVTSILLSILLTLIIYFVNKWR